MEEIKLGDKVSCKLCNIQSALVVAIKDFEYYALAHFDLRAQCSIKALSKEDISHWRDCSNKLFYDVDSFLGCCISWAHRRDIKLISSEAALRAPSPRICAKCGQFDEYAAPSAKHNGEMRCYLHC